jgi:SAM-dependent methyltransferase
VAHVIAVEPDPRMREILGRNCPEARVLAGTGEQMPLPEGQADALLISTAWHWLDPRRSVPEIARVLRSGGTFGVLWNHRDLAVPWVARLDSFTRGLRARADSERGDADGSADAARVRRWDAVDPLPGSLFSTFSERRFSWSRPVSAAELVGLMGTDCSAIALSVDARKAVDERVAAYVRDELELAGDKTIELPMACRCLRATKLPAVTEDQRLAAHDDGARRSHE